jgi:predicted acylesterase/phospholipase RssA
MAKKLAIVISGAVSLGSYEAGVTYEVLEAIAQHNTNCTDPEKRIEIDVITGASAGGITATVLAKALLCHGPTLRDPYRNPLYKAWVEKVKMVRSGPADPDDGLLEVKKDLHAYSLLNNQALDRIANEILPDNFLECSRDCPVGGVHPAASTDTNGVSEIVVGLALGNLNGFPLSITLNRESEGNSTDLFVYSQYKDNFVFRISRPSKEPVSDLNLEELASYTTGNPATKTWKPRKGLLSRVTWSQLREITLSSGAFPFAFAVRKIVRHSDQADQPDDPKAIYASRDSTRKAKAFPDHSDPFDGKYVYTDGGVFENEPIGLAFSLIESLSKDKDAGINDPNRYFLFIAPGARKASSDPFRSHRKVDSKTNPNNDPDHILVAKALASAIMGQSRFQEWITEGNQAKVLAITSEDGILLGDVFSAFGGFLDEKFRAYDYNIGREAAQKKLKVLTQQKDSPILPYMDKAPDWGAAATTGLKSAWMPENKESPKTWDEAKELFGSIAKTSTTPTGARDQISELNALLEYVDPATRKVIRAQLLARVYSLIQFIYAKLESTEGDHISRRRKSVFANLGFWAKAAWAMARGKNGVATFAMNQADSWLRSNIDL